MRIFLDLSLLALIVATVISCWHKGFIRSVLGTVKTVAAVILTYIFGPRASVYFHEHWVDARVHGYVHSRFVAMFDENTRVFDLSRIVNNLPDWLRVLFDATTADSATAGKDYAHMTQATADELNEMVSSFARPLSNIISDFLGYTLVFFGALLVLTLVAYLLGKIADLPIIRTCDRLLGFLLGVACAALYASVYTLLVFALLSMVEGAYPTLHFHEAFEGTVLFRQLYEYNVFRYIFGIG